MPGTERAIAQKKILGHLPYCFATRRQSFNLPNMISIRLRRSWRRLSYVTVVLRCFRPKMQGHASSALLREMPLLDLLKQYDLADEQFFP